MGLGRPDLLLAFVAAAAGFGLDAAVVAVGFSPSH